MDFSTSQSRQELFSVGEASAAAEKRLHICDEIPDSQDDGDIIMSSPDDLNTAEQRQPSGDKVPDAHFDKDDIVKSFVEMSTKWLEASNTMRDAVDKISATFNSSAVVMNSVNQALASAQPFATLNEVPNLQDDHHLGTEHDDEEYISSEDDTDDEEYINWEWSDNESLSEDEESEADDTDIEDEPIPLSGSVEAASDNEMEWDSELTRPAQWSNESEPASDSRQYNQLVELARPSMWSADQMLDTDELAYGGVGIGSLRQGSLRTLLENFVRWGQTRDEPAVPSFRVLLNQLDIGWAVSEYLDGIPKKVQRLFENESWSSRDLMALDDANLCTAGGVYLHIFPNEHRGQLKLMAYVGYTRSFQGRVEEHKGVIQGRLKYIPTQHYIHARRSHYNASKFKILAILDQSLASKYFILLESVFQILLRTVRFPGFTTEYTTHEMYNAARNFGESINCFSSLFGLNMALSVFQPMPHDWSHLDLPCKACGKMTFARKHGSRRALLDAQDPSKGYACRLCEKYRKANSFLPHMKYIERRQLCKAARDKMASITACETCSETLGKRRRVSLDGMVCCVKCYTFFNTHGVHSTPETRDDVCDLSGYRTCESCNIPFSEMDIIYGNIRRTADNKVCCRHCQAFFFDEGRHRTSPEIENFRMFMAKLSAFGAAHPNCEVCTRDLAEYNLRRIQIGKMVTCVACAEFYLSNSRHRNEKEVSDLVKQRELQKRGAATPACENCKTEFAITGWKRKRHYVAEKVVCYHCWLDHHKDGVFPPADKYRQFRIPANILKCQHCQALFGNGIRRRHKLTKKVVCLNCFQWSSRHKNELPPTDKLPQH